MKLDQILIMKNNRCTFESLSKITNSNYKINVFVYITNIKILANNIGERFVFFGQKNPNFPHTNLRKNHLTSTDINEEQFSKAVS